MTGTGTSNGTALAGRKEWTGLAVLFLPTLLISMDISVLFFALPFISEDLAPSGTQQLWIMDMYGFVLAGMLITMGALGDRIGRRRLLLIGATAFGIASVVAAYSGSAEVLIATRALLGLGGATLMPSTLALIRNMFHDARQRKTAISIWTGAMVGGATVGPIVGGFVLEHFWWGAAFLINVPAMVLLLVLAPVLLPEYRAPRPAGSTCSARSCRSPPSSRSSTGSSRWPCTESSRCPPCRSWWGWRWPGCSSAGSAPRPTR